LLFNAKWEIFQLYHGESLKGCVRPKRSPRRQILIQLESGEKIFIPVSHSGENKNKEK
jgi:hypothetical protein